MSKQGMSRPEWTHTQPHNTAAPVPEIQGKAKHGKAQVRPIIAGTKPPSQKVYHVRPYSKKSGAEGYPDFYSDLAVDNLENDIPEADLQ